MRSLPLFLLLSLTLFSTSVLSQTERKALKKAEMYLGYDEYKEAIPSLKEAAGFNPQNAMTQFLLGKCHFLAHLKSASLPFLEKATQLNPGVHPELPYYLAQAYHYTLEFDKAIIEYKKAITQFRTQDPEYREIKLALLHCEYGKNAVKNPNGAKIVNIGNTINTQWVEHSPVISADESIIIYTTVRPDNEGCKGDPNCILEDIWYAETDGKGGWKKPRSIGNKINTRGHDASIGLSPDGQRLFIYKNPPNGGDIFESLLEGQEWSEPANLGPPVNTKNYETTVSVSFDGKTLFFASDRPGGAGGLDIYTATLQSDGTWSEPRNLGRNINTAGDDDAPFIHPNGTLYFSSDGRKNCIGKSDIFMSQLLENGQWSIPENLGYPINTPDEDIYFVLSADGQHGYYASAKEGGQGEKDIYKIIMSSPEPVVKDTETVVAAAPKPMVVNKLTILKGTITDALTSEPVEASIKVIDNKKDEVIATFKSNSATGKYLISLPSGRNYRIEVENKDYVFHSENVDIPEATGFQEIEKNIQLKKITIGATFVLPNIFYDYDKATLRPESKSELDRLLQFLQDLPTMVIEIGGHTDADGSDTYNQKLSENRAKSVVEFLVGQGISRERLKAVGYGESVPIAPNDTDEGKQRNRRTEFKILGR